jgi:murein DD-endopeptidase MepM/ murein hydrolase activator NlpD
VTDRDDGKASFDPRSWGLGAGPPKPAIAPESAQDPSFDPRSWVTASPAVPPRPVPPERAAKRRSPDRQTLVAVLAGAAIAAAGFVPAWLARPTMPAHPAVGAEPQPAPSVSRRMLTVAGPGSITASLASAGIVAAEARAAGDQTAAALGNAPGDIRLVFDIAGPPRAGHLSFLEATHGDGSGLALTRDGAGYAAKTYVAHLATRLEVVRGRLDTASFYSAAVAAGLRDTLVSDFANAFAFDFDLQREVGPGDSIVASYEQRYSASGDRVGVPVLVYASLSTSKKTRALYRFTAAGDRKPGWYDATAHSIVRALMRTPIDGARISSPFGMRDHPILGFVKMHKGTDFAAPVGTPIYAAGDAVVEFAGPKGPNGNFVKLRHDNGWETLYLHMNRIWPQVMAGVRVQQGEQIGEVGTTGRSTGPHLHYEVHVGGEPVNPLDVDTGSGKALVGAGLIAFKHERARIDTALHAAK